MVDPPWPINQHSAHKHQRTLKKQFIVMLTITMTMTTAILTMMAMKMIQLNKPELIAPADTRGKARPLFKVENRPELGKKEISYNRQHFVLDRSWPKELQI